MKTFFKFFVLFIFILSGHTFSQWFSQNSGVISYLQSISMVDANTGYAVGHLYILKTTDGGELWTNTQPGGAVDFNDIQFVNSNTGYAVGKIPSSGVLYKTTDGSTWTLVYNFPVGDYKIYFANSETGYAVTFGFIYKTVNGGANWSISLSGGASFTDVFFINEVHGWVTSTTGNLYRTSDGVNWLALGVNPGWMQTSFYAINELTGWLVTNNSRIHKSNNAMNFSPFTTSSINISNCELTGIYFVNEQTGWVTGCQGTIYNTVNSGGSWNQQIINSTARLTDIEFVNNLTGWAVGTNGKILKTTNGGSNFVGISVISSEVPGNYSLSQNYPNPFNPMTNFKFQIPNAGFVEVKVFDVLGNEVTNLVNQNLYAGTYQIRWDASEFTSGVYYYKLISGDFSETKKMILIK